MRTSILLISIAPLLAQKPSDPAIPKTWDSAAFEDWATPLPGPKRVVRPFLRRRVLQRTGRRAGCVGQGPSAAHRGLVSGLSSERVGAIVLM